MIDINSCRNFQNLTIYYLSAENILKIKKEENADTEENVSGCFLWTQCRRLPNKPHFAQNYYKLVNIMTNSANDTDVCHHYNTPFQAVIIMLSRWGRGRSWRCCHIRCRASSSTVLTWSTVKLNSAAVFVTSPRSIRTFCFVSSPWGSYHTHIPTTSLPSMTTILITYSLKYHSKVDNMRSDFKRQ